MLKKMDAVLVLAIGMCAGALQGQVINTVAGTNWNFPSTALTPLNAPLGHLENVAVDSHGNVYAADSGNNIVFQVSPTGVFTVVAGNGFGGFSGDGGPALNASLYSPYGVAVDSAGNIYIADTFNYRIRKVSNGTITTVAGNGNGGYSGDGGPAVNAAVNPTGVAVDSGGNIYIADTNNNRIREVSGGTITTVAGNGKLAFTGDGGPAASAALNGPWAVAVDSAGNLYIADTGNDRIRKVSNGTITTFAGGGAVLGDGGPATSAEFSTPYGVAVDSGGNVYVADFYDNRIRKISGGTITTVAGTGTLGFSGDGGPATSAAIDGPTGVAVDSAGNLYIADYDNQRIRKVSGGIMTTLAGNGGFRFSGDGGSATSAVLNGPQGVGLDSAGNLYIADTQNYRVRKVSAGGTISTVAGTSSSGFAGDGGPATSATLFIPRGVAVDSVGNLYIADGDWVRKVSVSGTITTFAGTIGYYGSAGDGGLATSAYLHGPSGVAVDSAGNVFIADSGNNRIQKVSNGIITTVAGTGAAGNAGDGGSAITAQLSNPTGIAIDSAGNLYIADTNNNRVRKVSGGTITTVAGSGNVGFSGDGGSATSAQLNYPFGVTVDAAGNLYIADVNNERIRKVSGGMITTIAGGGPCCASGDGGPATRAFFFSPYGVAVDSAGDVYVSDANASRVREVLAAPISLTAAPTSLTFSGVSGGAAPPSQSVNLFSSVAGLAFSASVSSSAPWLSVTPSAGSTPAGLQVSVDPSQLSASTYTGTITIAGLTTVQTVNVTFNVSAPPTGKLGVSPATLSFSVTQGSTSTSAQLSVSNQGGGSIAFTASAATASGGNWLQVSPASGTATPTLTSSLTVTATPGNLGAGTYSGTILLSSSTTGGSIPVPVTLSISPVSQTILLSQTGLTFIAVAQGGNPLSQSFGILNTGQGSMNWGASASTLSGGPWLSIDQTGGTVATPFIDVSLVNVIVNSAGLSAGTYYGQIQMTSAGAVNSPQAISVVLNVLPAGSNPGAELQPTGLIFIGTPGESPGSQTVLVSNPQGSAITFGGNFFTVPTGGSWAQFAPMNATVQPNAPAQLLVQPNYANLLSGVYNGFVSLGFADGSARTVHVLAVVAPAGSSPSARKGFTPNASSACAPLLIQPTTFTDPSSSATLSQPATLSVKVVDNCGNAVTAPAGQVAATFSNGDAQVNLVSTGSGNWSGTWTPQHGTAPLSVAVTFTAAAEAGTTPLITQKVLTIAVQSGALSPLVTAVVNAASQGGTYVAPGGLVTIYGQQLAANTGTPSGAPFPLQLEGTQVLIGGKALPLRYVGSGPNGVVNAQVPFEVASNTTLQIIVQSGNTLSVPQNLVVAAAQPAVYTQDQSGAGPGVIFDVNTGVEVTPSAPASAGDVVLLFCNGLGAVTPAVPTGTPAPAAGPLSTTVNPLTVTIGGVAANVNFAGLAPGYPDLYQVNVVVPAGVTSGSNVPVVLSIAGQTSPTVTMAVR